MKELEQQKHTPFDLKNKQTIEQFGRDKCLKAYEIASNHIPLKPDQKYSTWQEQVAAELNVSEDEAMNLWAAENSLVQEKLYAQSGGVITKFGEDKCKEIHAAISEIMLSNSDWQKAVSEKYNIQESDVIEIYLAGSSIFMKESASDITETIKQNHHNSHNRPSCPKKGCDGKLHITTALSKELDGLYICDNCRSTFRKKK